MSGTFRAARPEEAGLLEEMMIEGIRHWGHFETWPAAEGFLRSEAPGPEEIEAWPVFVLEDDGQVIGFYSLKDHGHHGELLQMFMPADRIGTGIGRRLWAHMVDEARPRWDRLLIMSDPMADGFYERMGAVLEERVETMPGFFLGKYWYDLT